MTKRIATDFHSAALDEVFRPGRGAGWVTQLRPERTVRYRASIHYHPHADALIERLDLAGLDKLMDPAWQAKLSRPLADRVYTAGAALLGGLPEEAIDVSDDGPYAIYNWELFFHAPLQIAVHLSKTQRFEDAQRWFHRIFDPTSTDTSVPAPRRFWKFLRFRRETDPAFIDEVLTTLAAAGQSELKSRIENSIEAWRDKPFQPHVVARGRYLAYQISVLMKYLDNLIAWGDALFRQDTMEALNEATQLYVLAANLLGAKPQAVPPRGKATPRSFAELRSQVDAFGNALVELENQFPFNSSSPLGGDAAASGAGAVFGIGRSLYFCVPANDRLLAYWDVTADRLFKLRHCMNIEGSVRQLALFDPPIDPGMLVRAAAAGLDIAGVVGAAAQPTSTVRGPLLLQRALELCSEVKSFGAALLSALEKGDTEHAGLLRQQHETQALARARDARFLAWKEAEAATSALLASRATTWERFRHYKRVLGAADGDIDAVKTVDLARKSLTEDNFDGVYAELVGRHTAALGREAYRKETSVGGLMEFAGNMVVNAAGTPLGPTLPLNKNENAELNIFLPTSDTFSTAATVLNFAAPILAMIPQFKLQLSPFGVGSAIDFGGVQLSKGAVTASRGAEMISTAFKVSAERASRMGGYYRRAEDYVLQANLATSELEASGRQIVGALLREQATKADYDNHVKQIADVQAQQEFLSAKYTNEELYSWMQGELARSHHDCYRFAFDLARRAEQTLKHEVMRDEFDGMQFVKFGYWDGGRKGLLAGETLYLDLRRLEMAYLEQNRREYELTRHVSLARLDPAALLKLKATGACELDVPEWLYDLDSPGQYMRRIKTVALSVPCVTGPYTGVHCRLSLLRSSVRASSLVGDGYARAGTASDARFRDYSGAIQSIVTSTGQNDSGVFELNLRDDRYLPFENAGAISSWRLELPRDLRQFDYESIADVVLHVRYTAREAGQLAGPASAAVREALGSSPPAQLFTLRYDFGDVWRGFVDAASDAERRLVLRIERDRLPYWAAHEALAPTMTGSFAILDLKAGKVTLAPASVPLTQDGVDWTATIDHASPVFAFLKAHKSETVHLVAAYQLAS